MRNKLTERSELKSEFKSIELTKKNLLMFAIPAAFGFLIFLTPVVVNGETFIMIGVILQAANEWSEVFRIDLVIIFMTISAFLSIIGTFFKPKFIMKRQESIRNLFTPNLSVVILRTMGAILALMVFFEIGPEFITSPDTGGTMLDLSASIMIWFIVASFFIPFLLDFGLMEIIGTLLSKISRPLFKLPGRANVDLLTSFVGDQNLGVMLTNDQYVRGYYTARESVTIATCFSATGIGYWYIISDIMEVDQFFFYILLTVVISTFVVAAISTRLWPITSFSNSYYTEKSTMEDDKPESMNLFYFSLQLAVQKAQTFKGVRKMVRRSVDFSIEVLFGVVPIVMVVGVVGLLISTYTSIFEWLSLPFSYYLQLLQVPEAAEAAPAVIVGFADMLIPALISGDIISIKTRFIIAVLSLTQIIYMSEIGPVMLMARIPIKLWHMPVFFLIRTILLLPIIVLLANLFGIPG